jgi:hypothetical protein
VKHTPFRVSVFVLLTALSSALAAGQTSAPATPAATPARDATTASEDFDLDIAERRITESDFEASTEVSTAGEGAGRGLDLRVGVMVRAGNIDVLLRNVRGRVRFRASLEPVLRLLNQRRAAPTAAPPSTPPNPSP